MKKVTNVALIFVVVLLAIVMLRWCIDCVHCEILTMRHNEEFEYAYLSGTDIAKLQDFKVLSYSDHSAKVYYTEHGMASGNVVTFQRPQTYSAWEVSDWDVLWDIWDPENESRDFVYPYWWDYFYAYFGKISA